MKDFALQAAILDECQIYLIGGGERPTSPTSINPDACPLGTIYEARMAAHTGNPPS